jgi:hypothetical protein
MLNILNGFVPLQFSELSFINFRDINLNIKSLSANSIEPSQTARMCRLAWLYTGGKGLKLSVTAL